MKKLTLSFVAVSIGLSLHAAQIYATELANKPTTDECENQCEVNVPRFGKPLVKGEIESLPVQISADRLDANNQKQAVYEGNVDIEQGNRTIHSDKVTLYQDNTEQKNITLNGNIIYQDNLVQMKGQNAFINLTKKEVEIDNGRYHLVDRLGRGEASKMQFVEDRFFIMKDGSFTSCPIDSKSWNIEGSKIVYDNQEELLEVWNAIFRVADVPVFYVPYLQLPTGSKRRSGLLLPEMSYDSVDGMDVSAPIYWNIAPNYDATLTPRFIQRRGVQIQTQARYLNNIGLGTVAFDWLQHDSKYNENSATDYGNNRHRWLFHWDNKELINENWRVKVDVTRVSDIQYLNDLGSSYANETDGYLTQHYQLGFTDNNWDMNLNYKSFQSLRSQLKPFIYYAEPQLNLNYYDRLYGIDFSSFAQVSHFVNAQNSSDNTWRYHFEPRADYTIANPWASISSQTSLLTTYYDQDIAQSNPSRPANYEKTVSRIVPILSVDGKMTFQRDVSEFGLNGYTQTLEPRVKYTYIPYRDQSNILNYDSSLLQFDYVELFRDRAYSGLDRIASSNKITTGVTTRFYDENKIERFNLSIGQIYYFTASRTGDQHSALDNKKDTGSLTWAGDAYWLMADDLILRGGMQYDTRINEISLANAVLEYRYSAQKMVQFSYRYANKNYIDAIGLPTNLPYKQSISQLGLMASWPVSNNIDLIGSYFYDTDLEQTVDNSIGIHYSDCCWGVGLQYGRKINGWNKVTQNSEYENKFSINFELKGFGRESNATAKMLDFGLLPYKTAFE